MYFPRGDDAASVVVAFTVTQSRKMVSDGCGRYPPIGCQLSACGKCAFSNAVDCNASGSMYRIWFSLWGYEDPICRAVTHSSSSIRAVRFVRHVAQTPHVGEIQWPFDSLTETITDAGIGLHSENE